MLLFIIFVLIMLVIYFNPYIDIYYDYRNNLHIVFWYSYRNKRNYVNILGG